MKARCARDWRPTDRRWSFAGLWECWQDQAEQLTRESLTVTFHCSDADCFADGDQPWASPHSCFRFFHHFEGGSRTFCSPKTNSGAVSIPASRPSHVHRIRSSLQSSPHLHRTVPLSALDCLEIPSCMRTVLGVCDS